MDFCCFLSIYVDCCWFFNDLCWFMLNYVELCWAPLTRFLLICHDFCWFLVLFCCCLMLSVGLLLNFIDSHLWFQWISAAFNQPLLINIYVSMTSVYLSMISVGLCWTPLIRFLLIFYDFCWYLFIPAAFLYCFLLISADFYGFLIFSRFLLRLGAEAFGSPLLLNTAPPSPLRPPQE